MTDVLDLVDSWGSRPPGFTEWARSVSAAFSLSGLRLDAAARLLRVSPAELQAVLHLATMDDDDLRLLSYRTPKTTWFLLSGAGSDGVRVATEALRELRPGSSPYQVARDAVTSLVGPDSTTRISRLPADVFAHAAKKAVKYGVLRLKDHKALQGFASRLRTGQALTGPQVAYAKSLLEQLVAANVIRKDSPDNDQAICDQILDSLDT